MFQLRRTTLPLAALACSLLVSACDEAGVSSVDDDRTTLSLYLTDAPGDVAAVWIEVSEIYFQGGPGGRLDVLTEPTDLIEITELVGTTASLVGDLEVSPGIYNQLRFVLASAVLETTAGEVYAFGDASHPEGLAVSGELKCPGCDRSGLKVKLANDQVELAEGANGIVLDFDVSQSFGRMAGNSGKWLMRPVIHAVRTEGGDDPDDPSAASAIRGSVALATDGEGAPIELPECPAGQGRTTGDFLPVATAISLLDGEGEAIRRTGSIADDGSFEIGPLQADSYELGFEPELLFDAFKLVWQATVDPATVDVDGSTDVGGVVYTVTRATCEAIGGP